MKGTSICMAANLDVYALYKCVQILSQPVQTLTYTFGCLSRLEDPAGSPLSELSKWQRRQTLLSSVVEQLRTKECRAVIALLVAAKSRLLKKWKNTDLQ